MARKRLSVLDLAREAGLDPDEVLIALWEEGFDYPNGPGDLLDRGEANRARRALGLATRRELASPSYWASQLAIPEERLPAFLSENGVQRALDGGRLTKKAIHRLKAIVRSRRRYSSVVDDAPTAEAGSVEPPLVWEPVGRVRPVKALSVEDVLAIHDALVEDFSQHTDPIEPPGVKSLPLLESAVARPHTAIGDTPKYPTVETAAAALLHALVHNHPFHNGNKRTALVAMLAFLDQNSLVLTCDEDGLFKLVLQLAQHALVQGTRLNLPDREVLHVARWLKERTRWVEKGDRAISWRKLKQILAHYGCTFEVPATVGNRINITRVVESDKRRSVLSPKLFSRKRTLRTQVAYGGDGREVDKNTVNKIRHDLELDDDNGVDSGAFYDNTPMSPSHFIRTYRKTLRRLARF